MNDKLNEQVSALLDNELSDTEMTSVLNSLNQQPELKHTWDRYHLIGDVMRGEPMQLGTTEISERVSKHLESEPVIISAPKKSKSTSRKPIWTRPVVGAALAASVATVAVITAPGFLGQENELKPQLTASNIKSSKPVVIQARSATRWQNLAEPSLEKRLNGYLVDHSEHATPGTGMGVMPYATFVGYDSER